VPQLRQPTVVVGGGIAGLAAALRLRNEGRDFVLYEAAGRPGGVIRTVRRDGYLVDVGPNTLLPRPEALEQLIGELDLGDARVWADASTSRRYVVRDGKPVPLPSSPRDLVATPLLSTRAKLRLLREPFIRRGATDGDESLAAFVERRLGSEVLDYAVNPFVAGVFAGDPERLSARHAFPKMWGLERDHGSLIRGAVRGRKRGPKMVATGTRPFSFRDGMQTLPDALVRALGEAVHVDSPVRSIRRTEVGYALDVERAGQVHEVFTDEVILAVPAHRLAAMLVAPPVDLAPVAAVTHPPVTVLALGFRREDVGHPLDGFGVLVPGREPFRLLGALFSSTLFPGRAPGGHVLLTCFLGGMRHPEDGSLSEAEQVAMACRDLARLLDVRAEPAFVLRQPWSRAIPQYETGYGRVLETLGRLEAEWPGLAVAGSVRGGISLGEALVSGFAAADALVHRTS
jgi:protoporphyrinogen/coproporphyrinogen III oxidase